MKAPNPSSSSQHMDLVSMNAQQGYQEYLLQGSTSSSRQKPAQAVVGPPTAMRAELMNHPDQRGGVPSAWSIASQLHAASVPLVAGDEAWARDLQQWSESCTRLKAMVDEMESSQSTAATHRRVEQMAPEPSTTLEDILQEVQTIGSSVASSASTAALSEAAHLVAGPADGDTNEKSQDGRGGRDSSLLMKSVNMTLQQKRARRRELNRLYKRRSRERIAAQISDAEHSHSQLAEFSASVRELARAHFQGTVGEESVERFAERMDKLEREIFHTLE
jgi:hypothetical protein